MKIRLFSKELVFSRKILPLLLKANSNPTVIDDFVWRGATLNKTAKKLKDGGFKTVVAFAFVGNLDIYYEVINEM